MSSVESIKQKLAERLFPLRIVLTWLRHALRQGTRSVAGRMVYTLLALLVLLLLLQVQAHFARVNARRAAVREGQAQVAALSVLRFQTYTGQLFRTQKVLGAAVLSGRIGDSQVRAFLGDAHGQWQDLASIQVLGPDGTVRYVYPEQPMPAALAAEPFVRTLLQPGASLHHLSDIIPGPTKAQDTFRVSSLIPGPPGEAPLGIISMQFRTSALAGFVADAGDRHTSMLLDGAGILGYSSDLEDALLLQRPSSLRDVVAARRPGYGEIGVINGTRHVGYAAPIPPSGWVLVSLHSEPAVPPALRNETRASIIATLAVMFFVGGLGVAILRYSLRPLDRLSAAAIRLGSDARRMQEGSLSLPTLTTEVLEFERLAEAFNSMTADLEQTRRQLLDAQRLLERANTDLREKVLERESELEAEHQKLLRSERLSTLGLLSSAIAHDLRNPLNTIGLGIHWLKARLADTSDEKIRKRLETLDAELRRSDRIIKTLLAFARTGEPERQPTDLNALVREVVKVIDAPARIRVETRLAEALPEVSVDHAQLFQVLENLVRNAIQAMPEGGTVRIRTAPGREALAVTVSDTGPGIPPEMLDSVFEPLVSTKTTGTGLGLALCKRIIDAHEGTIRADSPPGQGAAFRIELPVSPEGAPRTEASPAGEEEKPAPVGVG